MDNMLAVIRARTSLTLDQLAKPMNTTASQVEKLEKGQRKLTIDWANRILKAFKANGFEISPIELLNIELPTPLDSSEIYLHGHITNTATPKAPWICPSCGTPYAPHVDKCEPCANNHLPNPPTKQKEKRK